MCEDGKLILITHLDCASQPRGDPAVFSRLSTNLNLGGAAEEKDPPGLGQCVIVCGKCGKATKQQQLEEKFPRE